MTITLQSKSAFGRFVHSKRHQAGLTQRELAELLYVTESAVSKWERGLSYPDISLVVPLAAALGVSEGELINASDDHLARAVETQAKSYRRWRGTIQWATNVAYALALLTSLVVNLSVQHTISWSGVVIAAVAASFSLTTLPLLVTRWRGWIVLGAFLFSLFALLIVVRLLYGGEFLTITVGAVMFSVIVVFLPFALKQVRLPVELRHRRVALVLGVDSLALLAFLLLVLARTGNLEKYAPVALPAAAFALAPVWAAALTIAYLPASRLYRTAIVVAIAGVFVWTAGPVFAAIEDGTAVDFAPVNLGMWGAHYIQGNVELLVLLGSLLAASVLSVAGVARSVRRYDRQNRQRGAIAPGLTS